MLIQNISQRTHQTVVGDLVPMGAYEVDDEIAKKLFRLTGGEVVELKVTQLKEKQEPAPKPQAKAKNKSESK